MTLEFVARLVRMVSATAAGSTCTMPVDGPADVDVIATWCENTGNTLLAVHPDGVEIYRGRVRDPIDALAADRRPGHRLWVYTNFHCNFTALDSLDESRAETWVTHLLAMSWDDPEHRRILELEGLREWVRPQLAGYATLTEAMEAQGIADDW